MRSRKYVARILVAALTIWAIGIVGAAPSQAASSSQVASLALANVGKGAGYCSQVNSSNNSLGGSSFYTSCTGNGGSAEYWCADFAKWVWANDGLNVSGITAGAGTFVTSGAGTVHTSSSYVPQVADAVVYDLDSSGYAGHVGLVTAINSDGSVQTVNGDSGGTGNLQTPYAETSTVRTATLGATEARVGQTPSSTGGKTISAFVTPQGLTSSISGAVFAYNTNSGGGSLNRWNLNTGVFDGDSSTGNFGASQNCQAADVDSDGTSDVFCYTSSNGSGFWDPYSGGWRGATGTGNFGTGYTQVIPAGNLAGGSTQDIFLYDANTGTGMFEHWTGTSWSGATGAGNFGAGLHVEGGDLTGDGRSDLLFVNSSTGATFIESWSGSSWSGPTHQSSFGAGYVPAAGVMGDINGDGHDDVFMYNSATGNGFFESLNNGTWSGALGSGNFGTGHAVAAGPIDGSDRSDIFMYTPSGSGFWERYNGGWSGAIGATTFDAGAWVSVGKFL